MALEQICQRLLKDEELLLLFEVVKESLARDESLLGTDMREDIYLKACMRDGVDKVYSTLHIFAEPSMRSEE